MVAPLRCFLVPDARYVTRSAISIGGIHSPIANAAVVLLSALARNGHDQPGAQQAAFHAGMEELELPGDLDTDDDANFSRLNEALKSLRRLRPLAKPKLIKACAAVAMADGRVSGREGALLQGVAAALDCPLPPSIYHGTATHG